MPDKNRFFNIPKKYDLSDYKYSINCIVKKYSDSEGLVSIYNWGLPSVPGISDIDILFVFKKNAKHLSFPKRSFYMLDSKSRYLARHPFVFIDDDSFKRIDYIYPSPNLDLLHGKRLNINKISKRDSFYSKISLLNDIIIRHYPRDFLEQFVSKQINVRDTLLRLNSLKYSIALMKDIAKEKRSEWSKIVNDVEKLRQNWFKSNNFELLVSLNEKAVHTSLEITERFMGFLIENSFVDIKSGNYVKYEGIKNRTIFIKDWSIKDSLQEMAGSIIEKKKFFTILPLALVPQLFEYSGYKGIISSHIRNNLSGKIEYSINHKKTIKKRIKILNSQAELALKLRHSDFPAFFDFGYRNKAGFNNIILRLLDYARF